MNYFFSRYSKKILVFIVIFGFLLGSQATLAYAADKKTDRTDKKAAVGLGKKSDQNSGRTQASVSVNLPVNAQADAEVELAASEPSKDAPARTDNKDGKEDRQSQQKKNNEPETPPSGLQIPGLTIQDLLPPRSDIGQDPSPAITSSDPAIITDEPKNPTRIPVRKVAMNLPVREIQQAITEQITTDLPSIPSEPVITALSHGPQAINYYSVDRLSETATQNLILLSIVLAILGLGMTGGFFQKAPQISPDSRRREFLKV